MSITAVRREKGVPLFSVQWPKAESGKLPAYRLTATSESFPLHGMNTQ